MYNGVEHKDTNHLNLITVCLYVLMFVYAISYSITGPLMPALIKEYNLKVSQSGLIASVQSIGAVLAILLIGLITDRIGKAKLIAISFIVFCLSILFISMAPVYTVLLLLLFIFGASSRAVDVISNAYVADIHPDKKGVLILLLHAVFGVGAIIGSFYPGLLLENGFTWDRTFAFLADISILAEIIFVIVLVIVYLRRKGMKSVAIKNKKVPYKLLATPKMLMICLIMFLFVGFQFGVTVWLPSFMKGYLHSNFFLSGLALTIFWVGTTLGRFVYSLFYKLFIPHKIILWSCMLSCLLIIAGVMSRSVSIVIIATGVTGFLTGCVVPLLFTMSCNLNPEYTGASSSMVSLSSAVSMMFFSWLIGMVSGIVGFEYGMLVTAFCLMFCSIATMISMRINFRDKSIRGEL